MKDFGVTKKIVCVELVLRIGAWVPNNGYRSGRREMEQWEVDLLNMPYLLIKHRPHKRYEARSTLAVICIRKLTHSLI